MPKLDTAGSGNAKASRFALAAQRAGGPLTKLLVALAISVPPAVITHFLTHDRLRAAAVSVVTVILTWLSPRLRRIGSQILDQVAARLDWENRFIAWASDVLAVGLDGLVSGYRRRYIRYIRQRCRDFDVKGLSTQGPFTLALAQVFVELNLVPQPLHQPSADPVRVLERATENSRQSIWTFLAGRQSQIKHFAVIGAPGSGKTTLLRHVALVATGFNLQRRRHHAPRALPLFVTIRDHAAVISEDAEYTLAAAVAADLVKSRGPAIPKAWIERQLDKGRCLILLDGLDEVADPLQRRQVVSWVESQLATYPTTPTILTSRPFGYRNNPVEGVHLLEVLPFTWDQVKRFVSHWYLANERMSSQRNDAGVRHTAVEGAESLLGRLYSTPALGELAVNPLLLTMIATVHRYRSSLPERRVELYNEVCEVFLGKRQSAHGVTTEFSVAQKLRVLQPLAYYLMKQQRREIRLDEIEAVVAEPLKLIGTALSVQDFLQNIEQSSGLLLEAEQGLYRFAHLTFQEYLTALHLLRRPDLADSLHGVLNDSWWHETIRLYAAQADNATSIVTACLDGHPPSVEALYLAVGCIEDQAAVEESVRARLNQLLTDGVTDADSERRRVCADVLLTVRRHHFISLDPDTGIDRSFLTYAEYQSFLDDQHIIWRNHPRRLRLYPLDWEEEKYPLAQGRAPLRGISAEQAEAFCKWLNRVEGGLWVYRVPTAEEFIKAVRYIDQDDLPDSLWPWVGSPKAAVLLTPFGDHRPSLSKDHILLQTQRDFISPAKSIMNKSPSSTASVCLKDLLTQEQMRIALQAYVPDLNILREILFLNDDSKVSRRRMYQRLLATRDQDMVPVTLQRGVAKDVLIKEVQDTLQMNLNITVRGTNVANILDRLQDALIASQEDKIYSQFGHGHLSTLVQMVDGSRGNPLSEARKLSQGFNTYHDLVSWSDAKTDTRRVLLAYLRWYLRYVTLLQLLWHVYVPEGAAYRVAPKHYGAIYYHLVVLEERIAGRLPGIEGLWLARERGRN